MTHHGERKQERIEHMVPTISTRRRYGPRTDNGVKSSPYRLEERGRAREIIAHFCVKGYEPPMASLDARMDQRWDVASLRDSLEFAYLTPLQDRLTRVKEQRFDGLIQAILSRTFSPS
jgi:hypothetical protein